MVKSHGIERYGKGKDRLRQVRALETNANGPMLACRNLDDVIKKSEEFLSKPIEHEITSLFVDATCLKVRNGLHYKNTNNI
ncbi:Mobile element protein [Methanosarcina vacuolata Z-761]|uniref:Mobile element protein n=1 Tax=Methanosarcina vacuolata Z-761 TaxID=1434123 RepID=A0A0E3LH66_9EURY|nr:Mobile element protein [Methanosarcina vacuolata Z-761]